MLVGCQLVWGRLANVQVRVRRLRNIVLGQNDYRLQKTVILLIEIAFIFGEPLPELGQERVFVLIVTKHADIAGDWQGASEHLLAQPKAGEVKVRDRLLKLGLVFDWAEAVEGHGFLEVEVFYGFMLLVKILFFQDLFKIMPHNKANDIKGNNENIQ